jgi:hypothetical protein
MDDRELSRNGVRVVVQMRRMGVSLSKSTGRYMYTQAVGIRSRREWYRDSMSRKQLVGITGQTSLV